MVLKLSAICKYFIRFDLEQIKKYWYIMFKSDKSYYIVNYCITIMLTM